MIILERKKRRNWKEKGKGSDRNVKKVILVCLGEKKRDMEKKMEECKEINFSLFKWKEKRKEKKKSENLNSSGDVRSMYLYNAKQICVPLHVKNNISSTTL